MAGVLYAHEHTSCYNYDKPEKPIIQGFTINKGQGWNFFSEDSKIILITKGQLCLSFGDFSDRIISKGEFLHLPSGYQFTSKAKESTTLLILKLTSLTKLCDCFATENLLLEKDKDADFKHDLTFLTMNEVAWNYTQGLEFYMRDGLKCVFLLNAKIKEFFYILRGYYTKKDLLDFFYLHLTNDISFSDFIHQNHHKAKTAQELADLSHYSLSGFQKRFKRVFGISVYNWMLEQRARNILHEINGSAKSFKEISNEYEFSSPSHFNNFCKTHFRATPGEIRDSGKIETFLIHTEKKERSK
ncbi:MULTISPECIES: helix-turn-helix transcriptional regulator [unclassified Dysgonomonas]|uniref:helix-turn-helix transcriptional regulator n=1 Tax=unclassified Dysgonomonas TaxID=2630389 RepID=UPI0013EBBE8E|nr:MULTISPECIES: AraC family transcriptional regulator [unclassified Dysgonomonas]